MLDHVLLRILKKSFLPTEPSRVYTVRSRSAALSPRGGETCSRRSSSCESSIFSLHFSDEPLVRVPCFFLCVFDWVCVCVFVLLCVMMVLGEVRRWKYLINVFSVTLLTLNFLQDLTFES